MRGGEQLDTGAMGIFAGLVKGGIRPSLDAWDGSDSSEGIRQALGFIRGDTGRMEGIHQTQTDASVRR